MSKRSKKQKGGRSRLKTGLKVAAGVALAGGALYAGKKIVDRIKGGSGGGKRRKRSAMWFAKEIMRLKLKKRYDKIKLGV